MWDRLARLFGRRRQQLNVRVVPALPLPCQQGSENRNDFNEPANVAHESDYVANGSSYVVNPASNVVSHVANNVVSIASNGNVANGSVGYVADPGATAFVAWLSDYELVGWQPWPKLRDLYVGWYCKDNRLEPFSDRKLAREMTRLCRKEQRYIGDGRSRRRLVHYRIPDLAEPAVAATLRARQRTTLAATLRAAE